jgi:Trypsin-co-occurring domain 2
MSDFAEVSSVIEAIKQEIRAAQQVVIGEPRLELVEVLLEINAVVTRSATAGLKAEIMTFSIGPSLEGTLSDKRVQKITISLQPPEPIVTQSSLDLSKLDLANTIVALRRELHEGLRKEPKLLPNKLDIEIQFAVQKDTNTRIGIKLIFLEIGPAAKFSSEHLHKIKLRFEAPSLPT